MQAKLMQEMYEEINFDPLKVNFVEAHSTGTTAGDPEECSAIEKIFCKDRKKPLLIGTIKSNIGHTEGCAGLSSVVKAILAFENNKIPPNINFDVPRKDVPGLHNGKLKVVTEPTELEGNYIGVNSFGFGGANAHALLKQNTKERVKKNCENYNRLVIWSGRTKNAVNFLLDNLERQPIDTEFVALLQGTQNKTHCKNFCKGFGVFNQQKNQNANCIARDVKRFNGAKRPMVWIFDGVSLEWLTVAQQLMNFPTFQETFRICDVLLREKGIDLKKILDGGVPTNDLHTLLVSIVAQIGVIDIFKSLKIEPDFYIGYSFGELACAYADGGLSLEQTILVAYCLGKSSDGINGACFVKTIVHANCLRISDILTAGIEVTSHDSVDKCTVIGTEKDINKFEEKLKSEEILYQHGNRTKLPFHSRFVNEIIAEIDTQLNRIIKNHVKRSDKWISSSLLKNKQNESGLNYCSSTYITNNFSSAVLFEEAISILPKNSLCINFSPKDWMKQLLTSNEKNAIHIELFQHIDEKCCFEAALGR